MKKILLISTVVLLLVLGIVAFVFLGSATGFDSKKETLYIASGAANKTAVLDSLKRRKIITNSSAFSFLAGRMNYWERIRPGKYEIQKGTSLLSIVRMLRNGQQTPVSLVITKLRTKEALARLTGARFEFDSAAMMDFLNSDSALKAYNLRAEEVMAFVLPDTYQALWNTSPGKVFQKLVDETKKFWTAERKQKAERLGLTPIEVATVASIVEEETNADAEKGNVASVYLNRVRIGMPLQADPTVKFALNDFSLKRIYEKHLQVESPYNTYRNRGLPPGPICTPSKKTIDAVLNSPATDYIYFVASPKFNGTHEFSVSYSEHLAKARAYQAALNRQDSIRKKLL
jgi:UPF0755 protein